jgi:hypothetical protein
MSIGQGKKCFLAETWFGKGGRNLAMTKFYLEKLLLKMGIFIVFYSSRYI